jgi:hypothetical protein
MPLTTYVGSNFCSFHRPVLIFQPTVSCRASYNQLCLEQHYSLKELRSCYVLTYKSGYLVGFGPGVAYWLRHYATSQKVPGSIPGGVTGDFFRGIRQFHVPRVDSASQNEYQVTSGGRDGRCIRLTTYHLQAPMSGNLEALTSQNTLGPIGR